MTTFTGEVEDTLAFRETAVDSADLWELPDSGRYRQVDDAFDFLKVPLDDHKKQNRAAGAAKAASSQNPFDPRNASSEEDLYSLKDENASPTGPLQQSRRLTQQKPPASPKAPVPVLKLPAPPLDVNDGETRWVSLTENSSKGSLPAFDLSDVSATEPAGLYAQDEAPFHFGRDNSDSSQT
jgi:hypothetical protein